VHVHQRHRQPGLGAHLGNAAAHLPGADYANVLNLHAALLALRVEVWLNYYHVYVNVNNALPVVVDFPRSACQRRTARMVHARQEGFASSA
jgi:hypothetical protein